MAASDPVLVLTVDSAVRAGWHRQTVDSSVGISVVTNYRTTDHLAFTLNSQPLILMFYSVHMALEKNCCHYPFFSLIPPSIFSRVVFVSLSPSRSLLSWQTKRLCISQSAK